MLNDFETIQVLLGKHDPKNEQVQGAFGVNEAQAEVLWAGFNAITAETGLSVPNFLQLAGKVNKYPSTYLTALKVKRLIKKGKTRGEWLLSKKTLRRAQALLNGEMVGGSEAPETTTRKTRTRKKKSVKLSRRVSNQTVGELISSLRADIEGFNEEIEKLTAQRTEKESKLKALENALI